MIRLGVGWSRWEEMAHGYGVPQSVDTPNDPPLAPGQWCGLHAARRLWWGRGDPDTDERTGRITDESSCFTDPGSFSDSSRGSDSSG